MTGTITLARRTARRALQRAGALTEGGGEIFPLLGVQHNRFALDDGVLAGKLYRRSGHHRK
jgi:hypothetical protein